MCDISTTEDGTPNSSRKRADSFIPHLHWSVDGTGKGHACDSHHSIRSRHYLKGHEKEVVPTMTDSGAGDAFMWGDGSPGRL